MSGTSWGSRLGWSLVAGMVLWGGCTANPRTATGGVEGVGAQGPGVRAVLFGYIPDAANDKFASLSAALARQFRAAYPAVPLARITIDPQVNLYDLNPGGELSKLLGDGPEAADVVEIDTLTLGELVKSGWVQAVAAEASGILPAAWQAATVGGRTYGVPTYVCTNVVYAHDPRLGTVGDGAALYALLQSLPGGTPLVGDYSGSWTLPSVYLDAWADTHDASGLGGAYLPPVDAATMSTFAPLVKSCAGGEANPCLDGDYSSGTGAESAFARGQANGFFGYTERLFYILSAGSAPVNVISAPLGGGSHPVMFVDALVVNAHCRGACLEHARAFIELMSRPATRTLIAFSQDAPAGTFPRYLLQANGAFYAGREAQRDPMYPQFWRIVERAVPFPNEGFPGDRKALGAAVRAALAGAGQ